MDRLVLTSGLGILPEPKLQILDNLSIKKNDILLMTTDGIHYAIRPEALSDICPPIRHLLGCCEKPD